MGNQPGSEGAGRGGSKKIKKGKKSKKEKDLALEELQVLIPYLERQLGHYEKRIKQLDGNGFGREYNSIKAGLGSPATVSEAGANATKNRYRNIIAYDHSRVLVSPHKDNGNNDYINANWLAGPWGDKSYIATQGPVPDSMFSFWQMVWETNAEVVVMCTNEVEGNRLKCHRYWPDAAEPMALGAISLKLVSEKPKTTYITRVVEITFQGETRKVTQFQYTSWPDHGVPNTTAEMLSFRKTVHRELNLKSPCVVHCSAGVGRSGTFIAIDDLMTKAESLTENLDPLPVVTEMRKNRNYMVQTVDQYAFIFRAMFDALKKSHSRSTRALRKRQRELASNGQDGSAVDEEQEQELDDLEDEILEATAGTEGLESNLDHDLVEGFKTLGRRAGARSRADAMYTHFSREDDTEVLGAVPRDVRVQSLAQSVQDEGRKNRIDTSIEGRGYRVEAAGLETRMNSLKDQANPDNWRQRLSQMTEAWVSDNYDVGTSLNPIESRMASLAQQNENYLYRSEAFKEAMQKETRAILVGLETRLNSLATSVASAEKRVTSPGKQDAALGRAEEVPLRARLDALKESSAKKRSHENFGKVVPNPSIEQHKKELARRQQEEAEEAARAAEAEAKRKEEERRKAEANKPKPEPVKEEKKEVPTSPDMALPPVALKKAEKKEESVHPMVAQAMATRNMIGGKKKK